jgi:hypothetical protein
MYPLPDTNARFGYAHVRGAAHRDKTGQAPPWARECDASHMRAAAGAARPARHMRATTHGMGVDSSRRRVLCPTPGHRQQCLPACLGRFEGAWPGWLLCFARHGNRQAAGMRGAVLV